MKVSLTIYCQVETTTWNDARDIAFALQAQLEAIPESVARIDVDNIDTEVISE